ncbi:MAG: exodeoxyribonuclease III [Alphaproteobacteria bacterium]|nr:exodeoxyribonuclease III [Alphaproteobacteria bacterium]
MRLATWNINSIRMRLPGILDWLEKAKPDVLLMQEIKCESQEFPAMDFLAAGYKVYAFGQRSYNGVAIASLYPIESVCENLPTFKDDSQARYLEARIKGVRVASVYVPNGNPVDTDKFTYKLDWFKRFKAHAAKLLKGEELVVLGGDFNVLQGALDADDITKWEGDALYHKDVRAAFREVLNLGYTEIFRVLHPEERAYSFWDYKNNAWAQDRGLRLDHFLLSPEAVDKVKDCTIDKAPRGQEKASDHTPVVLDIEE